MQRESQSVPTSAAATAPARPVSVASSRNSQHGVRHHAPPSALTLTSPGCRDASPEKCLADQGPSIIQQFDFP
jgi:hypothetical protein